MMELSKNREDTYCETISSAVLNLLIDEIRRKKSTYIEKDPNDTLTKQVIEFINNNLTDNLNVNTIAQKLNVSSSTLMHTFKKNINISIHKYIIEKRLILAHSKISNGEYPVIASVESGFNDYSGFYRQYKKLFDITPSTHTRKNKSRVK